MTLVWVDGFEVGSTSVGLITERYDPVGTFGTAAGRTGSGSSIAFTTSGTSGRLRPQLNPTITSSAWRVGFGVYFDAAGDSPILIFKTAGVEQCSLHYIRTDDDGGHFQLKRGVDVLATMDVDLPARTWYYLELAVQVSQTVGQMILRVDQVPELRYSGDTQNGGGAAAVDQLEMIFVNGSGGQWRIDDLVIQAGSLSSTDFFGVLTTQELRPAAVGADSEWGVMGGIDPVAAVADDDSDDATLYVEPTGAGQTQLYALDQLDREVITGAVAGAMVATVRRSSNGLNAAHVNVLSDPRHASELTFGGAADAGTSWLDWPGVFGTNAEGHPLEIDDIDESEVGVRSA